MKNKLTNLLLIIILIFTSFAFLACVKNEQEKYTAFEIDSVEIYQRSTTSYDIFVKLEKSDYTDIKFYFTQYDRLKDTDTSVNASVENEQYKLSIEAKAGDYFLFVRVQGLEGVMPLTLPKMSPFIVVDNSSDNTFVKLDFSIDGATSWSSFIDPNGKNVYKSEKAEFDDTALAVRKNINIIEGSINDTNFEPEKPHYFVVFEGKNGRVRFVSTPITLSSYTFSSISAELKMNESSRPSLVVKASFNQSVGASEYKLLIRTDGEEYRTSGTVNGKTQTFSFVLTPLKIENCWYDILLENQITGQQTNLTLTNKITSTVTYLTKTYSFENYEGDLKVKFSVN